MWTTQTHHAALNTLIALRKDADTVNMILTNLAVAQRDHDPNIHGVIMDVSYGITELEERVDEVRKLADELCELPAARPEQRKPNINIDHGAQGRLDEPDADGQGNYLVSLRDGDDNPVGNVIVMEAPNQHRARQKAYAWMLEQWDDYMDGFSEADLVVEKVDLITMPRSASGEVTTAPVTQ